MNKTKIEMINDTKRGMIGVAAFLLCIFFLFLPIVQCTQDSSFAATGWRIATGTSEKSIDGDALLIFPDIKEELIIDNNPENEEEQTIDSTPDTENEPIASYNKGNEYLGKGDLDQAIVEYTASLMIQPYFVEALNNRGSAYAECKDLETAIADYSATLCISYDNIYSLHNRSKAYVRIGDYDKAIADYAAILCIEPDNDAARNNLVFLQARLSWVGKAHFLVFIFLIIPIVLIILAFINVSFSLLRIISIIGIVAKIAFIVFVYSQYGNYLIPTIFCWIILSLYIGLCAFIQYCNKRE